MTVHLPPLPPTPDEGYRPAGRNLLDIIESEHRELRELIREATRPDTPEERRGEVREVFTAVLARHLSAEEQYLLPAARQAVPETAERVDREVVEDEDLLTAVRDLPAERLGEVAERLDRHVRGVDGLIGPLREAASEEELIRLGNRLEIAEEAAPTRPHPGMPHTPPWNRIVEPAVGVVDKLRDAVTGRHTHRSDL